ncbi:hypothetical protein Rt10032_c11g4387 [Rhodotorula toruloides]|uniref:Uncharacterized protein n=1 Tax=Rhodotorula toruloides TaxID=5286 RepID=A0A511KJ34_RHOTO|nr:hypothetical protein Rt10032_c11g4387 [Rhodotorula toruloides]
MGKGEEAQFSLVPHDENEAPLRDWQFGEDEGDQDTRLLPWANVVISPSLRNPERQFNPLTTFNFEARVEPAFMPMRIEARIVGVARARSANHSRKHQFLLVSSPPATFDDPDSCIAHFQVQLPPSCTCDCRPPPLPTLDKPELVTRDPDGNKLKRTDSDYDSYDDSYDDSIESDCSMCGREQGDGCAHVALRLPPTFEADHDGYSVSYRLEIVGQLGKPSKGKGKGKALLGLRGDSFKVLKEYKFAIPLRVQALPLYRPMETSAQLFKENAELFYRAATGAVQSTYIDRPAHAVGDLHPRRLSLHYEISTKWPLKSAKSEPVYFGGQRFDRTESDGPRLSIHWWIDVNFGKHRVEVGNELLEKLRATPTSVSLEIKRVITARSTHTGLTVDTPDESPMLLSEAPGYLDLGKGKARLAAERDGQVRLWLHFEGEITVSPSWVGDPASAPVLRSCIFDVHYDLHASFHLGTLSDPIHIKCQNVRLDLPASLKDLIRRAKQTAGAMDADQLPEGGGMLAPMPRPPTKLLKEKKGPVPTTDLPVMCHSRHSGLPNFSSSGTSTSVAPLTMRLADLRVNGDAPPAYDQVMFSPGVVDPPPRPSASILSAPAYAASPTSSTALVFQRGGSGIIRRLFGRRTSEQSDGAEQAVRGESAGQAPEQPPSWLESVTEKKS